MVRDVFSSDTSFPIGNSRLSSIPLLARVTAIKRCASILPEFRRLTFTRKRSVEIISADQVKISFSGVADFMNGFKLQSIPCFDSASVIISDSFCSTSLDIF